MMMWQGSLVIWTALALIWWLMAVGMVLSTRSRPNFLESENDSRSLTIFKALPGPLSQAECSRFGQCIETFVADMDAQCEMVIGCHQCDQVFWQIFVARMSQRYPNAQLKLLADPDPARLAVNPKISWMQILAPIATGTLWYWSDADIEVPPGTVQSLRSDFTSDNTPLVTSPYIIQNVSTMAAMIDALYVNLEFYPGVVLLGKLNAIKFGFGAGMLFEAETFRQRVDWEYLGTCLADDYHLGRLLQPVKLATTRVTTTPAAQTWRGALLHYLRWQKTIRWNKPGGFAAQILVLPILGWFVALCLMPTQLLVWLGLGTVLALDVIAVKVIFHLLNCRISVGQLPVIPLWSVIRGFTWLACWFPWPIVWRGKKWRSAYQSMPALPIAPERSSVDSGLE